VFSNWMVAPFTPTTIGSTVATLLRISYATGVYQGNIGVDLQNYLVYIHGPERMFVGPLWHYDEFMQSWQERRFTLARAGEGVWPFVCGLAKLSVLATPVYQMVTRFSQKPAGELSILGGWILVISVLVYMYLTLSGLSSMAAGLSAFFGMEPKRNYAFAFSACSMRGFVQRFHVSLYTFMQRIAGDSVGHNSLKWLIIGVLWTFWFRIDSSMLVCALFMGSCLALESLLRKPGEKMDENPAQRGVVRFLGRLYMYGGTLLMAAMLSQHTFEGLFSLLGCLFTFKAPFADDFAMFNITSYGLFLLIGVCMMLFSTPRLAQWTKESRVICVLRPFAEVVLLVVSIMYMV